jgi:hypothetical protein
MPELVLDYDYHTGAPELDATALEVRRLRRQADDLASCGSGPDRGPGILYTPCAERIPGQARWYQCR